MRYLRVTPKNPLVMSQAEREHVGHALGQLVGRLAAGQSLQFYVEAAPVRLGGAAGAQPGGGRARPARARATAPASARRRCGGCTPRCASRWSVTPTRRPRSTSPTTWSSRTCPTSGCGSTGASCCPVAARGWRWRRSSGRWNRTGGWRASRCTRRTLVRGDLEALDLSTHMLSGPEVLDLLWRRFNPTAADRTPERRPAAREQRLELVGELDAVADAREAARAAHALRELVAGSAIDCADQRHLRVDRDLEQVLYVATLPDATEFGWLLDAMQVQRPVHARRSTCTRSTGCASAPASRPATGGCSASTAAPSCAAARPTTRCSPRRRSSPSCSRSSPATSARRRSRSRSTSRSASAAPTRIRSSSPRRSSRPAARSSPPPTRA